MTTRSHAAFRQLPRKSYRELSDSGLDFQSAHSIHSAIPSARGLIELVGDESISDPVTYCIDDVIKHLRGACGVVDSGCSAATEDTRDPRREDRHE